MGRVATCAWLLAAVVGLSEGAALAQDNEAQPPGAPAEAPPAAEPPAEAPAESPAGEAPKEGEVATPSENATGAGTGWKDIVVVQRRPILKRRRLELMPTYNVSMNNSLVRHHGVGGQLNFYLSESLFIGAEGTYYIKDLEGTGGRDFLIGLDQRVLASVNRYKWSAFLDFGYVPIQGKATLFNATILHWDVAISAGVGVFNTEIIPKDPDPGYSVFGGYRIAGLLPGVNSHLWFNRWLALDVYLKGYLFADKLEPTVPCKDNVTPADPMCPAGTNEKNAVSQITYDLVFGVGLSFMIPPGYDYKTPR